MQIYVNVESGEWGMSEDLSGSDPAIEFVTVTNEYLDGKPSDAEVLQMAKEQRAARMPQASRGA